MKSVIESGVLEFCTENVSMLLSTKKANIFVPHFVA